MTEERLKEMEANFVGEDRGVLEQYCQELLPEVRRLRNPPATVVGGLVVGSVAAMDEIAAKARRAERERCAKAAESERMSATYARPGAKHLALEIADKIRALPDEP